jgi:predicted metal-dependent phosphoesterase TrpH
MGTSNKEQAVSENLQASTSKSAYTPSVQLKKYSRMTAEQAERTGKHGKADVHMHSTYSDGCATVEEILAHVQQNTELDVIAITDHDEIEGSLRARDLWTRGAYRFDFIVGEEISTKEGHLLALFIEKRIQPGLSMERSIDLIHEQGGLAVIAHPLHRFFRHSCQRDVMDRIHRAKDVWFDGVETWNASFCGLYANYIAMSANRSVYDLPELGNSDAHTAGSIGCGFSWFEGKTAQDLRTSIAAHTTAPAGKMWDMAAYYQWVRYSLTREQRAQRAARRTAVA